jgi:predicted nucleic acid-binding protein
MKDRRFSLDTNILVYAMDRDAGKRHALAGEIVDRAIDSDCVLTLQSLGEFYAAVTGKGKMDRKEAEAQINDWMELFPVASATPKSLVKAFKGVKEYGLSFQSPQGNNR